MESTVGKGSMMTGLRIYKRFKIIDGVKLNLSKSGFSLTMGSGPVKMNVGTRGVIVSSDLPGTGMYYRRRLDQIGKGK